MLQFLVSHIAKLPLEILLQTYLDIQYFIFEYFLKRSLFIWQNSYFCILPSVQIMEMMVSSALVESKKKPMKEIFILQILMSHKQRTVSRISVGCVDKMDYLFRRSKHRVLLGNSTSYVEIETYL